MNRAPSSWTTRSGRCSTYAPGGSYAETKPGTAWAHSNVGVAALALCNVTGNENFKAFQKAAVTRMLECARTA